MTRLCRQPTAVSYGSWFSYISGFPRFTKLDIPSPSPGLISTHNTKLQALPPADQPPQSCTPHSSAAVLPSQPPYYFASLRRDTILLRSAIGATHPAPESTTAAFIHQLLDPPSHPKHAQLYAHISPVLSIFAGCDQERVKTSACRTQGLQKRM